MSAKIIVVLNTGAGGKDSVSREGAIRDAFGRYGADIDILKATSSRHLTRAARRALAARPDVIAVAGGDGTVNGVATVLAGQDQAMGVIPCGTFNYFARSLGLPQDMDGAIRVIVEGANRATPAAWINDRLFLNNSSIGAYTAILQTREGVYKRWGRSRIAAYWSVAKALATFGAPLRMTVKLPGQQASYRTPLVFVMHNAFQLEQMGLPGRAHIESGQLVLLIAPHTGRWGLLRNALALGLGVAERAVDFEMLSASEIEITLKRGRRAIARDGEISRMSGPFTLRVDPAALVMRVPQTVEAGAE